MKALRSLWHGVDTAKVGYLVHWHDDFSKQLIEFRKKRELAQRLPAQFGHVTQTFRDYPQPFFVRPMGARMLPFAFESMGMIIFIGDTMEPWKFRKALTPNVRVEFKPWSVARQGLARVHEEAMRILSAIGGVILGNQLSEIHVTTDTETDRPHKPSDYHTTIDGLWRKVRTRMRTNGQATEGESPECRADSAGPRLKQINIGKDKKMLRVYDKLLELKTHPDKKFEALLWEPKDHANFLCDASCLSDPGTAVMRVEFQLRRERLLELQLSTVEDFLAKQGGLWQHLTEEFIVMIEDDDTNRSRCATQSWWQLVQKVWQEHPTCELPKRPKVKPDFKKYVDQAMGLMLSMGARITDDPSLSLQDITDVMETHWGTTHPKEWQELMRKKREKFAILWADLPESKEE